MANDRQKKVAILSIDGGGIRGIIPGTILNYLERQLQIMSKNPDTKLSDFFDFVSGTSTGGILACLYLFPDGESKRPKHSAEEALDLYLKNGSGIFHTNGWEALARLDGFVKEKYSAKRLENLLAEYFQDTKLSQLVKPCLITAYEITSRKAHFFRSVTTGNVGDFLVRDVARATSAAPTYFKPALIKSMNDQEFTLIDGGVFANNPALCAFADARKTKFHKSDKKDYPNVEDMIIVSVGTGTIKQPYHYQDFRNAGELKWLGPIIDILMSGNAETVHYQLSKMFDSLHEDDQKDYHRLEPHLNNASAEMDNVTNKNTYELQQAGLKYIEENEELLRIIAQKLVKNAPE